MHTGTLAGVTPDGRVPGAVTVQSDWSADARSFTAILSAATQVLGRDGRHPVRYVFNARPVEVETKRGSPTPAMTALIDVRDPRDVVPVSACSVVLCLVLRPANPRRKAIDVSTILDNFLLV